MKLILTGATGFGGQEVFNQCLQDTRITSVIVLSRRELPKSAPSHPKLEVLILDDFSSYPEHVLAKIAGADGCLWSMGAKTEDLEIAYKVDVDYPLALLNAIEKTSLAQRQTKFRFVYLSGLMAETDPEKALWYMPVRRRVKGEMENKLINFQKKHQNTFEDFILRPGRFFAKEGGVEAAILGPVLGMKRGIRVDELAVAMIDLGMNGGGAQTMVNEDIVKMGRGLLDGT